MSESLVLPPLWAHGNIIQSVKKKAWDVPQSGWPHAPFFIDEMEGRLAASADAAYNS